MTREPTPPPDNACISSLLPGTSPKAQRKLPAFTRGIFTYTTDKSIILPVVTIGYSDTITTLRIVNTFTIDLAQGLLQHRNAFRDYPAGVSRILNDISGKTRRFKPFHEI
jgi:hypothetical protein